MCQDETLALRGVHAAGHHIVLDFWFHWHGTRRCLNVFTNHTVDTLRSSSILTDLKDS